MKNAGTQLNDEAFRTFMCEAMAIVNRRPLSVNDLNDPASPSAITPNQLLTMKTSIVLPPPGQFVKEDTYSRKYWRRVTVSGLNSQYPTLTHACTTTRTTTQMTGFTGLDLTVKLQT